MLHAREYNPWTIENRVLIVNTIDVVEFIIEWVIGINEIKLLAILFFLNNIRNFILVIYNNTSANYHIIFA